MKPPLISELEKELNCTFESVDYDDIMAHYPMKVSKYYADANDDIFGIAICSFELTEIPKALLKCKALTMLNLGQNKIRNILNLAEFKSITDLDLSQNQISDISSLKKLKSIQKLWLSENQISDISVLMYLINIEILSLHSNLISDISALKNLKSIKALYAWSNLISDISPVKDMKSIQTLGLKNNQIKILQSWICDFQGMNIQWSDYTKDNCINLFENPIENVPIEILKRGKEAVKQWFAQSIKNE